jgi:hypothetical protein
MHGSRKNIRNSENQKLNKSYNKKEGIGVGKRTKNYLSSRKRGKANKEAKSKKSVQYFVNGKMEDEDTWVFLKEQLIKK